MKKMKDSEDIVSYIAYMRLCDGSSFQLTIRTFMLKYRVLRFAR